MVMKSCVFIRWWLDSLKAYDKVGFRQICASWNNSKSKSRVFNCICCYSNHATNISLHANLGIFPIQKRVTIYWFRKTRAWNRTNGTTWSWYYTKEYLFTLMILTWSNMSMKSEKDTICKWTKNKSGVLRYSPLVCVVLRPSALG